MIIPSFFQQQKQQNYEFNRIGSSLKSIKNAIIFKTRTTRQI